ncbi:zinc finger protein 737-like [Belonocnema kinseyi]|uniref:zinc finger protein 737-like n=1 Tax=Belonocnema kinseyi TaxID=2817044 RepID=UPI00143D993F|nr:zinc finger protein 737-like [Belonocnema kinseyi]
MDIHIKSESKKSTGIQDTNPHSRTTTQTSSDNKSTNKTLIEYDNDETLDIKEGIIQVPETIAVNKGNKSNESIVCTVHMKKDDILGVEHKPENQKKQEIRETEQTKKHVCKTCARSYKNKQSLTYHRKFECGVMPQFSCKLCSKQFKRKYNMNEHIRREHYKTRHNCDECARSYKWPESLAEHKSLVHAAVKPQFVCDFCSYKFNKKVYLIKHMNVVHSGPLKHEKVELHFVCDFCTYKTYRKNSFVKHINCHHSQTFNLSHKCDKCSRSYFCLSALNRHRRKSHSQISQSSHTCGICSRNYHTESSLYQHKRREHGSLKPQFNCAFCAYKTNRKDYLSSHISRIH